MEQQAGPGGWVNKMDMPSPRPGQLRLWSYQSIAHGANLVVYFRWRTAAFGQEIYWHGLNDYGNTPNRRVTEAAKVGKELELLSSQLAATTYQAEVAIIRDYNNEWDGEYDVWHGPFGWKSSKEWFKALTRKHIPSDVLYINEETTLAELQRYRLVVYPHPAIMTKATAQLLEDYVVNGGHIVFGCRSGYKDQRGHCYMLPFPGVLSSLTGITLEEYTVLKGTRPATTITGSDQSSLQTAHFNEIIKPNASEVEVLAVYDQDYYKGKPALTRNRFGKGTATYYGSVFTEEAANYILQQLDVVSTPAAWLELPEQVELALRGDEQQRYYFLLNYSEEPAIIKLHKPAVDIITNKTLEAQLELKGYGVLILRKA